MCCLSPIIFNILHLKFGGQIFIDVKESFEFLTLAKKTKNGSEF